MNKLVFQIANLSKKVESIVLEYTQDEELNIILLEMKSTTIISSDVICKFEEPLSWIYVLLNLLNDKENQKINVYGVLVAQKRKDWNSKENLNIFNFTSVRDIKRAFYTANTEININLSEIGELGDSVLYTKRN